ncbi:unnamed protein product [Rotaria sp. Silwood2]|nr:unnamed protein product [Rotaria sp. Silwood2]CAF4421866.1 unnamed protein product [Rotaria sp. Silwood2]
MNEARFLGTLLLLFHLRNCYNTKISSRTVHAKKMLKDINQVNTLGNNTASSITTTVNMNISQLSDSPNMEDGISFSNDGSNNNEEVIQMDDDAEE